MRNRKLFFVFTIFCIFFSCESDKDEVKFTVHKENFDIDHTAQIIEANISLSAGVWDAVTDADWVELSSNNKNAGESVLNISLSENSTIDARTATVTIIAQNKEIRVTIHQKGNDTFSVGDLSDEYITDGSEYSITVKAHANWEVKKISDPDNICELQVFSGKADTETLVRFKTIISDKKKSSVKLLLSDQEGKLETQEVELRFVPYAFTLSQTNVVVSVFNEDTHIAIETKSHLFDNLNGTSIAQDANWLGYEWNGKDKKIILFPQSNLTGSQRTGKIDFFGQIITVTQEASKTIKAGDHYIEICPRDMYLAKISWYTVANVPAGTLSIAVPPAGPQNSTPVQGSCASLDLPDNQFDTSMGTGWRLPTNEELDAIYQTLVRPYPERTKPAGINLANTNCYLSATSYDRFNANITEFRASIFEPDVLKFKTALKSAIQQFGVRAVRTVSNP